MKKFKDAIIRSADNEKQLLKLLENDTNVFVLVDAAYNGSGGCRLFKTSSDDVAEDFMTALIHNSVAVDAVYKGKDIAVYINALVDAGWLSEGKIAELVEIIKYSPPSMRNIDHSDIADIRTSKDRYTIRRKLLTLYTKAGYIIRW